MKPLAMSDSWETVLFDTCFAKGLNKTVVLISDTARVSDELWEFVPGIVSDIFPWKCWMSHHEVRFF